MYDNKAPTRYIFAGISFASSDVLRHIIGPKGKAGRLWDYGVQCVTTLFAGATTTPMMAVGTTGDADHYGNEYDFGAATVAGGSKSIRTAYAPTDAGFATYMLIRDLPKDTVVMATMVAATGGGAAGVADTFVEIQWDD
jgi:hypothetical protein